MVQSLKNQQTKKVAEMLMAKIVRYFWKGHKRFTIPQIQSYQGEILCEEIFFGTIKITVAVFCSENFVTFFLIRGWISEIDEVKTPIKKLEPLAIFEVSVQKKDTAQLMSLHSGKIMFGDFNYEEMQVFSKIQEVVFLYAKEEKVVKKPKTT